MPVPSIAAASPMASAQPNSPTVGGPRCGRCGMASENVPSPVAESSPMKISEPMPAASSPGTSTSSSVAPPSPDASISRNAPSSGEPSSVLMAAKLPAAATTAFVRSGASRLTSRIAQIAEPAAQRDQRCLRPEHHAQAQRGQCGQHHAGQLGLRGAGAALNPSAGDCPPVPGRYWMASGDQHPGQRPAAAPATTSARHGSRARAAGREDPPLQLGHQREEEIGRRRDGRADDRGEDQQHHVATAAQQGQGISRASRHHPRRTGLASSPG